jgi:hypothetical protein
MYPPSDKDHNKNRTPATCIWHDCRFRPLYGPDKTPNVMERHTSSSKLGGWTCKWALTGNLKLYNQICAWKKSKVSQSS